MKTVERTAYIVGGALLLSGAMHAAILLLSGGSWDGPLSWRKPATFGLSFGLTLINVTVLASFVRLSDRTRKMLLGTFAAACSVETGLVTVQAWRGVPSHFNVATPFDAAVAQTLAAGGFAIVAVIVALTVAALRDRIESPPALRLAIRAGFMALVCAQISGGVMIAWGMQLVFSGDAQRAYATGGWLKPVHAACMHGILVLPLLAWLISKTAWDERTQTRTVWAGLLLYAAGVGVVGASVVRTSF